jgi:hypothetical protein
MKLILFTKDNQLPHRKNYDAIQRMCRMSSIEFEMTADSERIRNPDYDMLMTCTHFIDPEQIPKQIKIIYGPQFFVFPSGPVVGTLQDELVGRCVYNCLSPWVKDTFQEMASSFIMPIEPLPFGVDTNYFRPYDANYEKIFDCILYVKRRSNELVNYAKLLLESKGLTYHVFQYGSYIETDYMYGIRMSKFMLVLDAHESQGFALEEAMSCNVPLLVMDATSMYDETNDGVHVTYDYLKPKNLTATSVPYWSDECGIRITKQEELSNAIDAMMNTYTQFTPRNYVLRTLSDEACMNRILEYFYPVPQITTGKQDVFIITSVINVGNVPWSYTPNRSVFTSEERFQQTLDTISSIRTYSPRSRIILVEASKLDNDKLTTLREKCDDVYYLGEDEEAQRNCIVSRAKGLGDAWLLYKGILYCEYHSIQVKNIFKLCGRYKLNDNFNRENISNDIPTFNTPVNGDTHSTIFFSVPYSMKYTLIESLLKAIHFFENDNSMCIEVFLPRFFPTKHVIDVLGIEGWIAVDESRNLLRI